MAARHVARGIPAKGSPLLCSAKAEVRWGSGPCRWAGWRGEPGAETEAGAKLNRTHLLETASQGSPQVSWALFKTMCYENAAQDIVIIKGGETCAKRREGGLVEASGDGKRRMERKERRGG